MTVSVEQMQIAKASILPPGDYRITIKLVCDSDQCQLVAEVVSGIHRGTQLVVQTYQKEVPEAVQTARNQCVSTLRVKYGSSEFLTDFIESITGTPESWFVFFKDQEFDRYGLYDAFTKFVYNSEEVRIKNNS